MSRRKRPRRRENVGWQPEVLYTRLPSAHMIKKQKNGYLVVSHRGRNLGGPYKTLEEARKRLRQVEFFKHRSAGAKHFVRRSS
jgi:hypothetical protein